MDIAMLCIETSWNNVNLWDKNSTRILLTRIFSNRASFFPKIWWWRLEIARTRRRCVGFTRNSPAGAWARAPKALRALGCEFEVAWSVLESWILTIWPPLGLAGRVTTSRRGRKRCARRVGLKTTRFPAPNHTPDAPQTRRTKFGKIKKMWFRNNFGSEISTAFVLPLPLAELTASEVCRSRFFWNNFDFQEQHPEHALETTPNTLQTHPATIWNRAEVPTEW